MKELVRVTEQNGKQLVSARELHEALGVQTPFRKWSERKIVNNQYFVDNEDYTRVDNFVRAGQNASEYALTLNTAKKISMAESTDKGNEVRDYFIECEKKLQLQLPQTFAEALQLAADQAKQLELQKGEISGLEQALDVSEQWISIIRAAKDYGVKETYFNWRELKQYSIDNGIEIKKTTCPRFGTKNLYHVSVFKNVYQELKHY